jgi:hypothetical protein
MRCLEKDVNRRVQTVAELAQGLAPFASPRGLISAERSMRLQSAVPSGPRNERASSPQRAASVSELPSIPTSAKLPSQERKDSGEVLTWIHKFDDYVVARHAQLGLTDATVAALHHARVRVDAAVARAQQAEEAVRQSRDSAATAEASMSEAERRQAWAVEAAMATLTRKQAAFEEGVRKMGRIVAALAQHDDMTNAAKRQLGIATAAPAAATLNAPAGLAVTAQPGRINALRWSAEGNGAGTHYLIEAAVGTIYRGQASEPDPNGYKLIATVADAATFTHELGTRVPAGVRVKYRVRARREQSVTGPSNEVMVACK